MKLLKIINNKRNNSLCKVCEEWRIFVVVKQKESHFILNWDHCLFQNEKEKNIGENLNGYRVIEGLQKS